MKINERNFIKYLKNKDEKALDYLVDNYIGIIKAIVNKHLFGLKNYQDECINDILLSIWNGIDKFDSEKGEFKNWLAAISKYKCIYYMRKYLNVKIIEEDLSILDLNVSDNNIERAFKKLELENEVKSLLEILSPKDKELFVRYYINEDKVSDIARDYNIKEDVIYNRISR